jgi:hypothetical protein
VVTRFLVVSVVVLVILIDANRFNGPSSKRHDDDDDDEKDDDEKDGVGTTRRDPAPVTAVNTDRRIFPTRLSLFFSRRPSAGG